MESVGIPYLPVSLWILAGAITILILLAALGFYIYWRRWAADLTETGEGVASLAARKQILEKDVEALREWIEVRKAELERLVAEREEQERLRAVLADLEHQCAVKNQENQELRNEVGELENQRHNVTQILEKMQREIGDLDAKRGEAQSLDSQIAELRSRLEEARQTIRNLAELEVKLNHLSNEKAILERTIEELRATAESAREEAARLNKGTGEARIEAEQVVRELREARREKAELAVIIDTLRQEQRALENSAERFEQKIDDLRASSKSAQEEAERDRQLALKAKEEAERTLRELVISQKERQRIRIEVGELHAKKAVLEQEVLRLEGRLGSRAGGVEAPLAAYADLLEKPPLCLSKDMFAGGQWDDQDESYFLQRVKKVLQKEGLVFPQRIIDAFHTSLKCHDINPITVLAGVSGTGKTLLPVRYAEIMGMHRLVMAVQPRWDSPQDMFGFYNYLEKEYKATELSRALVRMDPFNYPSGQFPMLKSEWAKDRLMLVLMDEMNLARTEYYFSEFLSRLELRRTVSEPSNKTNRSEAEIELDAGPGEHRFRLWVGPNVFFVGTMNEDETTQTLSDKVLDRANVLRFGKPDEKVKAVSISSNQVTISEKYLSFDQWKRWRREFQENSDWYEPVSKWTTKINAALNRVGRPFGFRVLQAIGHYVANYPRVEDGERYKLAFADQIEQKIIPKIRGIDLSTENSNECLEEVGAIIGELDDRDLGDAFESARNESRMIGMFQWRGVTHREEEDTSGHAD
jgi:outer membrane murein-binding lipoprotein Lpp